MKTPTASPVERLYVQGDSSGHNGFSRATLYAGGVIDEQKRWAAGNATLVQVGDQIFDRALGGRANVADTIRLKREAKASGGRLVSLAGNHEMDGLYALNGLLDTARLFNECAPFVLGAYEFLELAGRTTDRRSVNNPRDTICDPAEEDRITMALQGNIQRFDDRSLLKEMWGDPEGAAFLEAQLQNQLVYTTDSGVWVMHMDSTNAQIHALLKHGPEAWNTIFHNHLQMLLDPDLDLERHNEEIIRTLKLLRNNGPMDSRHRNFHGYEEHLSSDTAQGLHQYGANLLVSGHTMSELWGHQKHGVQHLGVEQHGEGALQQNQWAWFTPNLACVEHASGSDGELERTLKWGPDVVVNRDWTTKDLSSTSSPPALANS
jgi:hypothetical protein